MEKAGDILHATRLKKGISLHQAEEATKIRAKYLDALEKCFYEQIPGRVYALGFLCNYSRFLGLDSEKLLSQLKQEYPAERNENIITEPSSEPLMPVFFRKCSHWLLMLGGLLIFWLIKMMHP